MLHRRSAIQALLLSLAGCWTGSTRSRTTDRSSDTLDDRLRKRGVTDDDFFRTTLYTWTTTAAVADLRATRRLLVATASSGTFVSPFNKSLVAVGESAGPGSSVARVLATHPSLIRRRYAWPSAFATVLGLGKRSYGNALLEIELRPEAWIGRFDPHARDPFRFVDATGAPIANDRVLATPTQIGAIFHVRTEPGRAIPFREYVVTNPTMIASWSVATDEIRTELAREVDLLWAIRERAVADRGHVDRPASAAWTRTSADADTSKLWSAALAFDGERYQPRPRRLAVLAAALGEYDPAGAPLVTRL